MLNGLPPTVLARLVEAAADAVLIMDAQYSIRYVNLAMATLCGRNVAELIGQPLRILVPEVAEASPTFGEQVPRGEPASDSASTRELYLRHRTGETIPIEVRTMDLGGENGTHYIGAFIVDLREQKAAQAATAVLLEQLRQQALTDEVTQLPNRRAFDLEAARVMANAQREGWPVSVGIADIDWFKKVNDQNGHAAGDEVLRKAAQTIESSLRAGDLVGRFGGDEFGLLLPRTTTQQAGAIIERIRTQLQDRELVLSDQTRLRITMSVGLAPLNPRDSLTDALSQADAALYQAKLTGRNRVMIGTSQ